MRISQSLISNVLRQSADRAAQAVFKARQPVLEGTSLPTPSTDMAKAGRANLLDLFDRELARHDASRINLRSDLDMTELSLQGIGDVLVNAQDLALQLASDNVTDQARRDAASNAQGLLDQIVDIANRPDARGRYQFTGLNEGQPPLAADLAYQGNDGERIVEVAPGVSVASTLSGRDVFGPNNELINSLRDLVSAVKGGDSAAVRATLTGIESSRVRVSSTLQQVGRRMSTLDDLGDLTLSLRTSVQIEQGNLARVDIAQVAPAIQSAQTMLEAVLTTSQSILAQMGKSWFG